MECLCKAFYRWQITLQLFRTRIIQHHNLAIVLIKLVIVHIHRKHLLNPDLSKQAQEVTFSRKCTNEDLSPIYFNNISVTQTTVQKRMWLYLDKNLSYDTHEKEKLSKVYKWIGLFGILSKNFTIYKAFIRLCLDYGDKPHNGALSR